MPTSRAPAQRRSWRRQLRESAGTIEFLRAHRKERARFANGNTGRQQVADDDYFVSRLTKEIGSSSRVGFMLTSVDRRLPDELSILRRSALSGGVDGYTRLGDQSWILEASAFGTRVSGRADAIAATQTSSARYFQRPDAESFHFVRRDLALRMFGIATVEALRLFRPSVQLRAFSPGFEVNDIGFMTRTDIISSHAVMQYVNQTPTTRFREKNLWFGAWQNRNFDGDTIERGFFADWFATTSNYFYPRFALFVSPGAFDDRLTRGGPVVRTPLYWSSDQELGTDDRKKYSAFLTTHFEGARDDSYGRSITLTLSAKPMPNLQVSVAPSFNRSHFTTQYVTAVGDSTCSRISINAHSSSGRAPTGPSRHGSRSSVICSRSSRPATFTFPRTRRGAHARLHAGGIAVDPNFNFRSLRGSAVARWEFRPGSALYVAWNENRATSRRLETSPAPRHQRDPNAPSHDVFLVKLSYGCAVTCGTLRRCRSPLR